MNPGISSPRRHKRVTAFRDEPRWTRNGIDHEKVEIRCLVGRYDVQRDETPSCGLNDEVRNMSPSSALPNGPSPTLEDLKAAPEDVPDRDEIF